jgi:hypothetical protein
VPAGRLDIDSTGLLVLTQDGRVARHLIGEDHDIDKEYLVRVVYTGVDNPAAATSAAIDPRAGNMGTSSRPCFWSAFTIEMTTLPTSCFRNETTVLTAESQGVAKITRSHSAASSFVPPVTMPWPRQISAPATCDARSASREPKTTL